MHDKLDKIRIYRVTCHAPALLPWRTVVSTTPPPPPPIPIATTLSWAMFGAAPQLWIWLDVVQGQIVVVDWLIWSRHEHQIRSRHRGTHCKMLQ